MTVKTREFKKHNYRGVYFNGKTIRIALDPDKPITELDFPEFYDVKITGKCYGGCQYCYQDSTKTSDHYDVLDNIDSFFGSMSENEKPFQVAIGGGEPTLHPEFLDILGRFYNLGITPNYTTNGMLITDDMIKATEKYCGGVAISCHKHLDEHWRYAYNQFSNSNIKINFHNIISGMESIEYFKSIYNEYNGLVEYFVLLPYIAKGRAGQMQTEYDYLFDYLKSFDDTRNIAFGANFYDRLKSKREFPISLYEPEILSKYLDMKDMKIYKSSFE